MNIIFSIQGGMGKSIMATAVCKAIKKQYPDSKLIVVTGYQDVFLNLDYVDMCYHHGQEFYFYEKYIQDRPDTLIFANEPYIQTEHILRKEHTIETWCKMNGIIYNGESPEVSINEREFTFYSAKYVSEKPIMVIQTNGGAPQQEFKYSWARDIPNVVVTAIIQQFAHKYNIYHIRRQDQFNFEKTIPVEENYKGIATLIARSQKRLFMDSFCQHLAGALNLKSTVLWIANSPDQFGYNIHDNILANPETKKPDLRHAFLSKYNITGTLHEFPYHTESEIFNIDKIIRSIEMQ
jgi:hypothetical protein